nr:hypothetical protein [Tanacetum cinerariifolium]
MKPTNNPGEANTAPGVNIQELCEEYYEDILPIIMEKVRHERRKDVHTRLDFGEGPRERIREDSHYSNARAKNAESKREVTMKGVEKASAALENHMVILSPTPIVTKAVITIQREETGLRHPACREAIQAKKSTTRMPNNIKTYDGTDDPEDHVKVFQAAAQVERWAMPTWCHMFNSTLIGAARRDGETLEDFMERFKIETGRIKGAPECMRISGFMHRINNSGLTKRLNEHVPKTMEEMMMATTAFIRGEAAAASKKKGHVSWKPQDQSKRHTDKRPDFRDECMQLKKQIEELVRAGKLSYLIKEIKQGRE